MLDVDKQMDDIKRRMSGDDSLPGPGWNHILAQLNAKLSMLDPDYKILQIKEKFGTLRFYYETNTTLFSIKEAMDRYIRYAEIQSSKTCEKCGAEGSLINRKMGWMKTVCKNCAITGSLEAMSL